MGKCHGGIHRGANLIIRRGWCNCLSSCHSPKQAGFSRPSCAVRRALVTPSAECRSSGQLTWSVTTRKIWCGETLYVMLCIKHQCVLHFPYQRTTCYGPGPGRLKTATVRESHCSCPDINETCRQCVEYVCIKDWIRQCVAEWTAPSNEASLLCSFEVAFKYRIVSAMQCGTCDERLRVKWYGEAAQGRSQRQAAPTSQRKHGLDLIGRRTAVAIQKFVNMLTDAKEQRLPDGELHRRTMAATTDMLAGLGTFLPNGRSLKGRLNALHLMYVAVEDSIARPLVGVLAAQWLPGTGSSDSHFIHPLPSRPVSNRTAGGHLLRPEQPPALPKPPSCHHPSSEGSPVRLCRRRGPVGGPLCASVALRACRRCQAGAYVHGVAP